MRAAEMAIQVSMAKKKPDYKSLARLLLEEIRQWDKEGRPDTEHPDGQGSKGNDCGRIIP